MHRAAAAPSCYLYPLTFQPVLLGPCLTTKQRKKASILLFKQRSHVSSIGRHAPWQTYAELVFLERSFFWIVVSGARKPIFGILCFCWCVYVLLFVCGVACGVSCCDVLLIFFLRSILSWTDHRPVLDNIDLKFSSL